jgi:hypothetical protein
LEKELNKTIMKLSAGLKLPLNRVMHMLNTVWEIVIILEKELNKIIRNLITGI